MVYTNFVTNGLMRRLMIFPTNDQQVTTNKNVKNIKNVENVKKEIKEPSQKSPKRTYSEDDLYYRLANRFHKLAFENATEVGTAHLIKKPNILQRIEKQREKMKSSSTETMDQEKQTQTSP